MKTKRILAMLLSLLMVLTILPTAIAETESDTVYAYSAGGIDFYACDETGTNISETLVDPNTITHLYLAPQPGHSNLYPLLIEDQTTLQWVTVVDPDNYGVYLNRDLFTGYVNLKELHLPEVISGTDLEIVEYTSLRSFTLPQGSIDDHFFQGCTTIEEIINPTDSDVTLHVHYEDITIPAGETWKAEFAAIEQDYYSTPGADLSVSLQAVGADGVNPVTWAFTEGSSVPDGFTLTQDGLLTGKYPADHEDVTYIYVTATNGEKTADTFIYLDTCDPIDVTVNLPEGATLVSGPVGENAMNIFALNAWTFAIDSDELQLRTVRLIETYSDGSTSQLPSDYYTVRGDTLLLVADELGSQSTLTIEPIFAKDVLDAIETATPLTFPCEETAKDSSYVYIPSWGYAYDTVVYKADLKFGEMMNFTWANPEDGEVDTLLAVFTKEEADMNEHSYSDSDNVGAYGESGSFIATEDATYYIFAMTYSDDTPVGCKFTATLSQSALPENPHLTEPLNFTDPENLPEPDEDGCWIWDAATKTLTLKDGFAMLVADDEAINLPADATLKVDGKATVTSRDDAISGKDNLTVELGPKADLTLLSLQDETIDLDKGLLKINGKGTSKLTTLAYSDDNIAAGDFAGEEYDQETDTYTPIINNGEIQIKDTILVIQCDEDAIAAYEGNITMDGCKVTMDADSDGFLCDWYNEEEMDCVIALTDCTVNATCDDQAFDNRFGSVTLKNCNVNVTGYCVFEAWDTITVEGGRLAAQAVKDSPVAWFYASNGSDDTATSFTVEGATFYLTPQYFPFTNATNVSLSGNLILVDRDQKLLYSGEWDEEAIAQAIDPDNGIYPTLIASVLAHGDADADGELSAADALQVLKSVVGKVVLDTQLTLIADVDGDEKITAQDALWMLKKIVGKVELFPVEQPTME